MNPRLPFQLFRTGQYAADSDAELLRRFCEDRCEQAYVELAYRHIELVWVTCWRVLHCNDLTKDAVQVTPTKLAVHAKRIRQPDTLALWLRSVAHRQALGMRMKQLASQVVEQTFGRLRGMATQENPQAGSAELLELMGTLPAEYRETLELYYCQGLSCREISKHRGEGVEKVKKDLQRGRQHLLLKARERGLGAGLVAATLATTSYALTPDQVLALARSALTNAANSASVGGPAAWWLTRFLARHRAAFAFLFLAGCGYGLSLLGTDVPPAPRSMVAAAPAEPPRQKNLRIFREEVVPRVTAALQKVSLWNEPVKVLDIMSNDLLLMCLVEQRASFGKPPKTWLTTRTLWHYNTATGAVHVNIDEKGDNHWRAFDLNRPIWGDIPFTNSHFVIKLPQIQEALQCFKALALEPLEIAPPVVETNPTLRTLKPFLGRWLANGQASRLCIVFVTSAGRPLYIDDDGRVFAVVGAPNGHWAIEGWRPWVLTEDGEQMSASGDPFWRRSARHP